MKTKKYGRQKMPIGQMTGDRDILRHIGVTMLCKEWKFMDVQALSYRWGNDGEKHEDDYIRRWQREKEQEKQREEIKKLYSDFTELTKKVGTNSMALAVYRALGNVAK
uniref:Transposase n=1 Tax=Steinernema glaseri TaxID=37863 RepID=A0A1I7ZK51_9BILA